MQRAWLELFDWEFVTAANAALCQPRKALHQPTSDGHELTRRLWEQNYLRPMFLDEAVDLCRQCHRLAPFCNFNGNTFTAVARNLVDSLKLKADQAYVVRTLAGHIVAGTASELELREFLSFSRSLTPEQLKKR